MRQKLTSTFFTHSDNSLTGYHVTQVYSKASAEPNQAFGKRGFVSDESTWKKGEFLPRVK